MKKKDSKYYSHDRSEQIELLDDKTYKCVLELGCGAGNFLKQINAETKIGIELDAAAAELAKTYADLVVIGNLDDKLIEKLFSEYTQPIDLLVCNDVLEHLTDPERILSLIVEHMAEGGCLIGSIPNVRHYPNLWHILVQRDFEYEGQGIRDTTHYRFYTKKSLDRMLGKYFTSVHVKGLHNTFMREKNFLRHATQKLLQLFGHEDIVYRQLSFKCSK